MQVLSSMSTVLLGMWVLFFAAGALTVSLGLILAYHWIRHAHNPFMTFVALTTYSAVSAFLLSTMFGALIML